MNWAPNSLHVFRFVFYVNGFYNNLTKNFFVQHYMISINKLKYVVYACIYGETTVLYLTIIKKIPNFLWSHVLSHSVQLEDMASYKNRAARIFVMKLKIVSCVLNSSKWKTKCQRFVSIIKNIFLIVLSVNGSLGFFQIWISINLSSVKCVYLFVEIIIKNRAKKYMYLEIVYIDPYCQL